MLVTFVFYRMGIFRAEILYLLLFSLVYRVERHRTNFQMEWKEKFIELDDFERKLESITVHFDLS